jgi:two-component system chemotaxis response regulator CheB
MSAPERKISVLIVEDSPAARLLLQELLESDPRLHVSGTAASGEDAIVFLARRSVDVVVMDVHLPGIDGYETTRRIMETHPTPIVICTASASVTEVAATFRAFEAGALAMVAKPAGPFHPSHRESAARLLETVVLMAEVKVVKRWPRGRRESRPAVAPVPVVLADTACRVVAIGTSTGGPPVLQTILSGLPADLSAPVLVVQHIAPGFLPGLIDWLGQTTALRLKIAEHDEPARNGWAYFAPDGFHLGLSANGRIALSRQPPENGLRPAVSFLFRSVASVCGPRAIAVLLTGMGRDGADELKLLHDLGAVTVAQDQGSSVVHGMPGEAIRLGGVSHVMTPDRIAGAIIRWTTAGDQDASAAF